MNANNLLKYAKERGTIGEMLFALFCAANSEINAGGRHGQGLRSDQHIDFNITRWVYNEVLEEEIETSALLKAQVKSIHPKAMNFEVLADGTIKLSRFYPQVIKRLKLKAAEQPSDIGEAIIICVYPESFPENEHPSNLLKYIPTPCLNNSYIQAGCKFYLYVPKSNALDSVVTLTPAMMITPRCLSEVLKKIEGGTFYD